MDELIHIRFVRDYSQRQCAGKSAWLPSHIAHALCEGDDPFAVRVLSDTDEVKREHRAITKTTRAPRPKAKRKRTKKNDP